MGNLGPQEGTEPHQRVRIRRINTFTDMPLLTIDKQGQYGQSRHGASHPFPRPR